MNSFVKMIANKYDFRIISPIRLVPLTILFLLGYALEEGHQISKFDIEMPFFSKTGRRLGTYTGFKPEFTVSSTSTFTGVSWSSIAMFSDESFVVVWSATLASTGNDVYAQILSKEGSKISSEIRVNTYTADDQDQASVVVIQNDEFIVVWSSKNTATYRDIYAKKFTKEGTELIGETIINEFTSTYQHDPTMITLNSGKIIVFFSSSDQSIDTAYGIFAHEIDTDLNRIGSAIHINTFTNYDQKFSDACSFEGGGFAVTWTSTGQVSIFNSEIILQIFDDQLIKVGSEVQVNTNTSKNQSYSKIAALEDGGFIVTWQTEHENDPNNDIAAQKFDASGNKIGTEFKVNDTVNTDQKYPISLGLPNGNFLIAWYCLVVSSYYVHFKIYDNDLSVVNPETILNIDTGTRSEIIVSGAVFANEEYILCYSEINTYELRCRLNEPCLDPNCIDCFNNSNYCESCSSGYILDSGSCVQCESSCQTCSGSLGSQCLTCISGVTPYSGYCKCPMLSVTLWEDPLLCGYCDIENCSECICYDCDSSVVDGNNQTACNTCNDGYFLQNGECSECGDHCNKCVDLNDCIECTELFEVSNGICHCVDGYYYSENECLSCYFLCSKCTEKECTECKQSLVLENGNCVCPHNYRLIIDSCVYDPLDYDISLESDYIMIEFTENLKSSLSRENINKSCFEPGGKELELIIDSVSLSTYVLRIGGTSVPSGTKGILIRFQNVIGSSGVTLDENKIEIKIQLEETEDYMKEEDLDIEGVSSETVAESSSISGAAATLGVSLISGNPSSMWTFLNFIILIYYMPLQNVGMPIKTRNYFKSFSFDLADMIPSSSTMLNTTSDASPSEMWTDYGISSTDFLYNNRSFLLLLGIGILLFVLLGVILSIWKEGKYRDKLHSVFKAFKWSYFLRIWIVYYIKIVLSCLLSITTVSNHEYNVVHLFSLAILVFCGVCVVLIGIGTYRNRERIQALENYESFFDEFKCNRGFMSMLYYPLFFLRRYLYIVGIFFLEDYPLVQVCINSFFSFFVVSFLVCFRPFKDNSLNVLNILLEFIVSIMFILSGVFLVDLSNEQKDRIGLVLYILSLIAIFSFFVLMVLKLIEIIKSFKSDNSLEKVSAKELEEEQDNDLSLNRTAGFSNREINIREDFVHIEEYHKRLKSSFN